MYGGSFCVCCVGDFLSVYGGHFVVRGSCRSHSNVIGSGSSTCRRGVGLLSLCVLTVLMCSQLVGRELLPGSLARLQLSRSLSFPVPREICRIHPLFAGSSFSSWKVLSFVCLTSFGMQDLRECFFLLEEEKFFEVE